MEVSWTMHSNTPKTTLLKPNQTTHIPPKEAHVHTKLPKDKSKPSHTLMLPQTPQHNYKLQLLNNPSPLPLKLIKPSSNHTRKVSLQALPVEPHLITESSLLDMELKPDKTIGS